MRGPFETPSTNSPAANNQYTHDSHWRQALRLWLIAEFLNSLPPARVLFIYSANRFQRGAISRTILRSTENTTDRLCRLGDNNLLPRIPLSNVQFQDNQQVAILIQRKVVNFSWIPLAVALVANSDFRSASLNTFYATNARQSLCRPHSQSAEK